MRIIKSERKETTQTTSYLVTLEFSADEGVTLRMEPHNIQPKLEAAAGKAAVNALSVLIQ